MFSITEKTGKRSSRLYSTFFVNEDVANYVASTLTPYVDGDTTVPATVQRVVVDNSETVEAYQAQDAVRQEQTEAEAFAAFFNGLSAEHQRLLQKRAAVVPTTLSVGA